MADHRGIPRGAGSGLAGHRRAVRGKRRERRWPGGRAAAAGARRGGGSPFTGRAPSLGRWLDAIAERTVARARIADVDVVLASRLPLVERGIVMMLTVILELVVIYA